MSNSSGFLKSILLTLLFISPLSALALETPSGSIIFPSYSPVINPIVATDANTSKPIGFGSVAEGGDTMSIKLQLESMDQAADLYFAMFVPQLAPSTIFFITETGGFVPFSGVLPPWKQAVSKSIDESLLGDIPVSSLPEGDYSFYLLQAPAGINPLENYYLWSTTLKHRKGLLFDTGNPSAPYIYTHKSQASVQFNANPETGGLVGTTIISPLGQILNIGIDEASGLPTHLVVEDTIFQIGNIRQDEGLADVTIIDTDGEVEYFYDIDYDAAAKKSALHKRADNSLLQKRDTLNVSGKIYDGGNAAYYIISCAVGPVVLAAKVAKVPDFIFDSSSVAGGCVSSMDLLLGHIDSKTEALSTDTADAVEITAELASLGINTVGAAGSCFVAATTALTPAIALTGLNCLYQLSEIAQFSGSKTIERLIASHELVLDRQRGVMEENKKNFKAFCCDGPTRIEVGEKGSWSAKVNAGVMPYRFVFNWGDGPGDIIQNVNITEQKSKLEVEHTYDEVGTYTIEVEISDSAFNVDDSEKFTVEVVEKEYLAINCCSGDAQVEKDTTNTWQPTISGAVPPYLVKFDWGDNNKNTYIVADTNSEIIPQHKYVEDGDYKMIASVTVFTDLISYMDGGELGIKVSSQPFEVSVGSDKLIGSWEGCDGRVVRFSYNNGRYEGRYTELGGLAPYHFTEGELGFIAIKNSDGSYSVEVKWRWLSSPDRIDWKPSTITVKGGTDTGSGSCSAGFQSINTDLWLQFE
ncbi:MAG: hypothetical protein KZQ83_16075 [gamma proteobacterium symbiont of Taylorina sp.]|nr:hypothetical protein [gamma proteobacterium symbiont of Taylorina sp.]